MITIPPDGRAFNAGGWGHGFGDDASAYDIAVGAIRRIFHASDGFSPDPAVPVPDTTAAAAAMRAHFGLPAGDRDGMLEVFYKAFDKARIAGLTARLAEGACGVGWPQGVGK
jgi:N-acetylglucosamine kinase-like BadF-type ATPase